jgi:hypothetical protein
MQGLRRPFVPDDLDSATSDRTTIPARTRRRQRQAPLITKGRGHGRYAAQALGKTASLGGVALCGFRVTRSALYGQVK